MEIYQILNNNVITSIENGKEVIIIGTGIGFGKRKGDIVDKKIQNKFYPANNIHSQQIISLIDTAPDDVINIVNDILNDITLKFNIESTSGLFVTLLDHVTFAIKRYENGMKIKNPLLWDVKRLYNKEFEIGLSAIQLIKDKLNICFSEDEAAFIALHIVNTTFNINSDETSQATHIINEILKIIEYNFQIDFIESSISYLRLINHLKFFAQRIVTNTPYPDDYGLLVDMIRENYGAAFECAVKIKKYIETQYNIVVTADEITYLSIHIQRILDTK